MCSALNKWPDERSEHLLKRILIMIDWFAPGYRAGGPIQSCVNVALALKEDFSIYVLTTDTDLGESEPYSGIVPNVWTRTIDPAVNVFYIRKREIGYRQIKSVIEDIKPDFLYLNSMYSLFFVQMPIWMKITGQIKSKIILCPRGALYDSALSVKRYKKLPFLRLWRMLGIDKTITFHATNERESMSIYQNFPNSEIVVAGNFPSMRQKDFMSCFKQKGVLNLLYISRIHPIKNLLLVISALEKVKSKVSLSIIGPTEELEYWENCKRALAKLPDNITWTFEGPIESSKLPEFLLANHLYILPTKGENFGHTIFEAFVAGRPVLISDQTPWLGLQKEGVGWDLPLSNEEAFSASIDFAAGWSQDEFDAYARASWSYAAKYVREIGLKQQYFELFS